MDNSDNIKFKDDAGNGQFIRISIDEAGNELSRTASFSEENKPGTMGHGFYQEMQAWIDGGGTVEEQYAAEEQAVKDAEETEAAKTAYIDQRKSEYPDPMLYNDAKVKQASSDESIRAEGVAQEQKYLNDCLAVKTKYPKPEVVE